MISIIRQSADAQKYNCTYKYIFTRIDCSRVHKSPILTGDRTFLLTGDSITASVEVSSLPVVLAAAAVAAAISAASRRKGRSFIVLAVVDGVRQMLNRYSLRLGCSRTKSDEMVHEQQVSSPFLASFSSSSFFDRLPAAMTKRKQNYSLNSFTRQ